jgi:hypothetical protein
VTFEPTVLVTSQTAAEIHLAGEVDEVFASTQEGCAPHRRVDPADGRVGG